jgi:hypothetical protein
MFHWSEFGSKHQNLTVLSEEQVTKEESGSSCLESSSTGGYVCGINIHGKVTAEAKIGPVTRNIVIGHRELFNPFTGGFLGDFFYLIEFNSY